MNNIVIENVFLKKDIEEIKENVIMYMDSLDAIEDSYDPLDSTHDKSTTKILRKFLGRVSLHYFPLNDNIISTLSSIVEKHGFSDYEYVDGTTYIEYSGKYGNPKLPAHNDEGGSQIILDYHIDSNIDWPIVIDNKEFKLNNNSLLIFDGVSQEHGRPVIKMKANDFVKVLLIRFTKKEKN